MLAAGAFLAAEPMCSALAIYPVKKSLNLRGLDHECPPPLHSAEAFAEGVACGVSAAKRYAMAYARPPNGATRASAARLLTNANVKRRIGELRFEAAEQAKASLRVLFPALEERARAA